MADVAQGAWWDAVFAADVDAVQSLAQRYPRLLGYPCPMSYAPAFDPDFISDAALLLGTRMDGITAVSVALLQIDCDSDEGQGDALMLRKLSVVNAIIKASPPQMLVSQRWGANNSHLHLAAFLGEQDIVLTLLNQYTADNPPRRNDLGFLPVDVTDDPDLRNLFRLYVFSPSLNASLTPAYALPRKFQRNEAALAKRAFTGSSSNNLPTVDDIPSPQIAENAELESLSRSFSSQSSTAAPTVRGIQFTGKYVFAGDIDEKSYLSSNSADIIRPADPSRKFTLNLSKSSTSTSPPPPKPVITLDKNVNVAPNAGLSRISSVKKRIKGVDLSFLSSLDVDSTLSTSLSSAYIINDPQVSTPISTNTIVRPPSTLSSTASTASLQSTSSLNNSIKLFSARKTRKMASTASMEASSSSLANTVPESNALDAASSAKSRATSITGNVMNAVSTTRQTTIVIVPQSPSGSEQAPTAAAAMAKWKLADRTQDVSLQGSHKGSYVGSKSPPSSVITPTDQSTRSKYRRTITDDPNIAIKPIEGTPMPSAFSKLRRTASTSSTHSTGSTAATDEDTELASKFAQRRSLIDAHDLAQDSSIASPINNSSIVDTSASTTRPVSWSGVVKPYISTYVNKPIPPVTSGADVKGSTRHNYQTHSLLGTPSIVSFSTITNQAKPILISSLQSITTSAPHPASNVSPPLSKSSPPPHDTQPSTTNDIDQAPVDFRKIRSAFANMTQVNPNVPKVPGRDSLAKMTPAHMSYEPKHRGDIEPSIFALSVGASGRKPGPVVAEKPMKWGGIHQLQSSPPLHQSQLMQHPPQFHEKKEEVIPTHEPAHQRDLTAEEPLQPSVEMNTLVIQEEEEDSSISQQQCEVQAEELEDLIVSEEKEEEPISITTVTVPSPRLENIFSLPKLVLPNFSSTIDDITQSSLIDCLDIFDQLGNTFDSPVRAQQSYQQRQEPPPLFAGSEQHSFLQRTVPTPISADKFGTKDMSDIQPVRMTSLVSGAQGDHKASFERDKDENDTMDTTYSFANDDSDELLHDDEPYVLESSKTMSVVSPTSNSDFLAPAADDNESHENHVEVEHGKFSGFPVPKARRNLFSIATTHMEPTMTRQLPIETRPMPNGPSSTSRTTNLQDSREITQPYSYTVPPKPTSVLIASTSPSAGPDDYMRLSKSHGNARGRRSPIPAELETGFQAQNTLARVRSISDTKSKKVSFKLDGGKLLLKVETIAGFDTMKIQKERCDIAAMVRCGDAESVLKRTVTPRDPVIIDDETAFKFDQAMRLNIDVCMIVHTLQQNKSGNPLAAAKKFFSINRRDSVTVSPKWETEQFLLASFSLLNSKEDIESCHLKLIRRSAEALSVAGQCKMRIDYAMMFIPHTEDQAVPKLFVAADTLRELKQLEDLLLMEGYLSQHGRHGSSHRYWRNQYFKLVGWQLVSSQENSNLEPLDLSQCIAVKAKEQLPSVSSSHTANRGPNTPLDLSTVPHSFRLFFKHQPLSVLGDGGVLADTDSVGAIFDFYAENETKRSEWIAAISDIVARFTGRNAWLSSCM